MPVRVGKTGILLWQYCTKKKKKSEQEVAPIQKKKREKENNQEKVAGRIKRQQRSKHGLDRGRRGDDKQ